MAAVGVIDAFTLPPHLEAAEPPEGRGLTRDGVRLLVSRVDLDSIVHSRFSELGRWLSPGDLLVVNTSGTLRASLLARAADGRRFEVHLSTRLPGGMWVVEVRLPGPVASLPCRDAGAGSTFELEGEGRVTLLAPYPLAGALDAPSRLWTAALQLGEPVLPYLQRFGSPIRYGYVTRPWPDSMYQTVFATELGSAEMPSAGASVHRRARHSADLERCADRALVAPHRCRKPGGPRTARRGVLSRPTRDSRSCQRDMALRPSRRGGWHDRRPRARNRH